MNLAFGVNFKLEIGVEELDGAAIGAQDVAAVGGGNEVSITSNGEVAIITVMPDEMISAMIILNSALVCTSSPVRGLSSINRTGFFNSAAAISNRFVSPFDNLISCLLLNPSRFSLCSVLARVQ